MDQTKAAPTKSESRQLPQALEEKAKGLPSKPKERLAEFLSSIQNIKFLEPDGKPNWSWKVFYGKTWAEAREAAHKAAEGTTSIKHAAIASFNDGKDTARTLMNMAAQANSRGGVYERLGHAASDLVEDSAKSVMSQKVSRPPKSSNLGEELTVANNAASISRDFGSDAKLMVESILVSDLEFESKRAQLRHAEARWEVWQKGYGLLADVEGTLYVYALESAKPKSFGNRLTSWLSSQK